MEKIGENEKFGVEILTRDLQFTNSSLFRKFLARKSPLYRRPPVLSHLTIPGQI